MRNSVSILLCFAVFSAFAQTGTEGPVQPDLKNNHDSLNYFLGLSMGHSLVTTPWEMDLELVLTGITHAATSQTAYDRETSTNTFQQLLATLTQQQATVMDSAALENLENGRAFLAENATREGVITTESGLQYEVIIQGDGPKPTTISMVFVHYEGSLIDGTVFDSSYEREEPLSFPIGGVIQGWTEGLQLMPVGSTYKLYIPSELAYGSRDNGPIPANSVLIFKVELLGIE